MSDASNPQSLPVPAAPVSHDRKGLSPVWIIPIVAALLGVWLVWQHYSSQGPLIEVRFETADGVSAGKTAVQCRSVSVGVVESVRLAADLKSVLTKVRIDHGARNLLRSDTRFWVMRPRFGGSGISGLGTLVSGTYIELDPGSSGTFNDHFTGLENPPVTPQGVPGLHVTLVVDEAGSIGPGSTVFHRGIKVGRIESQKYDSANGRLNFGAFIQGEFGRLVTQGTRFWNVSGVDLHLGADGISLHTGTLDSLISGGVAFDTRDDGAPGAPADDGAVFRLYENHDAANDTPINARLPYLLLFKSSVRGLNPNAAVEFRGIRVGTVIDISFDYLPEDPERRVPVLIKLDPDRIAKLPDDRPDAGRELIAQSVRKGLKATLRTGSLLTGQLFVDLDFYQEEGQVEEISEAGGYLALPTVPSGLARLEDKLVAVLDKIQGLKIEETVSNASSALAEIKGMTDEIKNTAAETKSMVANLDKLLASNDVQNLPGELTKSLDSLRSTLKGFGEDSPLYHDLAATISELNSALRTIESLASTIERKPGSLLWGNSKDTVTPPKGKR